MFGTSKDPQVVAQSREIRSILGLKPDLQDLKVFYGGYSGKDNEIDMMTRSMLQIMMGNRGYRACACFRRHGAQGGAWFYCWSR